MLRAALDDMTQKPLAQQSAILEQLRAQTNHLIVAKDSAEPLNSYTCADEAFCLAGNALYYDIALDWQVHAGKEFIHYLLEQQLLTPRDPADTHPGDLIIYFESGVFQHVGRLITPARVLSKWGRGLLLEHGVWEVPTSYGNEERLFVGPGPDDSRELFFEYAETCGVEFEDGE